MTARWIGLLLVVGSAGVGERAVAQPSASADTRLLRTVYEQDHPVLVASLQAADWTAYPVFYAAPVVAWGVGWLQGGAWEAPYRLTLAWAGTLGSTLAIKHLVRRPRPFVTLEDIEARVRSHDRRVIGQDSYGFPSGHAALSFALATSISLSSGAWYVAVPSLVWASGVSVSRVWFGVHYPSDVVAGALLGAGIGYGVHLLRDTLTPRLLKGEDTPAPLIVMRLRLP